MPIALNIITSEQIYKPTFDKFNIFIMNLTLKMMMETNFGMK